MPPRVRKPPDVGFNATRRYRDAKSKDVAILVAAVVIIGAAVAWATGLIG